MITRWLELAAEVAQVASRNPLRTSLTAMGVFWGTFMLVVMLGFGASLEHGVMRTMGGYATNAVHMWGRRTSLAHAGRQPGWRVKFRNHDRMMLEGLPGVALATPRLQLGGYRDGTAVTHGEHSGAFQVMGDTADYDLVQNVVFTSGRFVNVLDQRDGRKVAALGREVAGTLFPDGDDPLGQWITIQGVAFQVIGVFRAQVGGEAAERQESSIHVPLKTFQQVFHQGDRVGWYSLLAEPGVSASAVEDRARKAMMRRHGVNPGDNRAIGSYNAEKEFSRLQNLFVGIRWMVWFVGAATLASGVVGVSNILLIVVKERTSEIGLRRALGATPWSIVRLVLTEAIVLTTVSGYGGLVAGIALVEGLAVQIGPDHPTMGMPSVDVGAAIGAVVLLTLAGACAGLLPAQRALAVHPVTALRADG